MRLRHIIGDVGFILSVVSLICFFAWVIWDAESQPTVEEFSVGHPEYVAFVEDVSEYPWLDASEYRSHFWTDEELVQIEEKQTVAGVWLCASVAGLILSYVLMGPAIVKTGDELYIEEGGFVVYRED